MLTHEEKVKVRNMLGIGKDSPIPDDVTAYFDQCVARFRQCNWVKPLPPDTLTELFILGERTGAFTAAAPKLPAKPKPEPKKIPQQKAHKAA